jgi:ribosomal protein RSM22 (predicted rRNA methylase)
MKIKTSPQITPFLEKILLNYSKVSYPFKADIKFIRKVSEDVKAISNQYTFSSDVKEKKVFKEGHLIKPYVIYYLPVNLVKLYPILDELLSCSKLNLFENNSFSLLDLGCGPGTFMLGFLEYIVQNYYSLPFHPEKIFLRGFDREKENLSAAEEIISTYLASCPHTNEIDWNVKFKQVAITSAKFHQDMGVENIQFDLIIAGNVLTELKTAKLISVVKALQEKLLQNGAIIIIEPGTRDSSRNLIMLRDRILQETALNLFAPCPRPGPCPLIEKTKNWCHEKIFWDPPAAVRAIDNYIGFTKKKGLKYSYLTLVKKKTNLSGIYPDVASQRVWRVASYLIKNKGQERLYVCNGTERMVLRRLLKNSSEGNADFTRARRGDRVFFDGFHKHDTFLDITKQSCFRIL